MMKTHHYNKVNLVEYLTVLGMTWLLGTVPTYTTSSLQDTSTQQQQDLQPPHSVKVEAKAEHSFTLSWQAPEITEDILRPIGYVVNYADNPQSQLLPERTLSVSADTLHAIVADLQPGTNYTVQVAARYQSNQSASSLPFIVSTLMPNNAIDRPNNEMQHCDCYPQGTARCAQEPTSANKGRCVCQQGFSGHQCNACTAGYYMTGGQCMPCDCPLLTSSGTCIVNIEVDQGRECSCLRGHEGPNCNECSSDYFWYIDQCLHCNCLVLCSMNKGHQHCNNCNLLLNATINGLKTCSEFNSHIRPHRTHKPSDGTVAVIAVMVSLTFIASVAGSLWCYRTKCQPQTQSSLWSMELHEEKVSLNSACDYQRLDAAAINAKQDLAAKKQRQRGSMQSNGKTPEGNHKYHCISI